MPEQNVARVNFNRGKVSALALSRTDIERVELSAEEQTNFVPRVLGSMMLRPGTAYIDSTKDDAEAWHIPFVKSTDDTALVEFTDEAIRFRVDEDVVTRATVSAQTTDGTFDGTDAISNVTVAGVPTEAVTTSAFNTAGTLFATGQVNSPYLKTWSVSGTTFTALSNPTSLPTGQVNSVAFSPNGQFLAVGLNVTPYIEVYTISGTTLTKLGAFSALAGAAGFPTAVSFSPDGLYMAVAHATTPFCTVYSISGTTFTKLIGGNTSQFCNSGSLPTGTGMGTSWRVGSGYLAVAHTTTPFISIYSVGAVFTKLSNPAALPAGNATACAYAPNVGDGVFDLLAVAHTTTPFFTLYAITDSGGTYTKLTNVSPLPDGNASAIAFSPSSLRLTIGHATTQFATNYHVDPDQASFLVIDSDPGTLPTGQAFAVAFSPLNQLMCVGMATSPYLQMYQMRPWIDYDQVGTTSQYFGGILGTRLLLAGSLFNESRRAQAVYIPTADLNVEHAINITVTSGPIILRLGSTFQGTELFDEVTLGTGYHSLAFTPTTNFVYIYLASNVQYNAGVADVTIASSGALVITSPYDVTNLPFIRWAQSGDVIFMACEGIKQYKIERRGPTSWSLVEYLPEDGPFRTINTTRITITPSALAGQITLTASRPFFESSHLGSLIKLTSIGQSSDDDFTGANQFSATEIKVTGVGTARNLSITRAGTWSATVTLQRSISEPGAWTDVATFTTNGTATYNDALDNQIIYYRIGIKTGNYTSGTAEISMNYSSGGLDGVARITFLTSATSVFANVLRPLGSLTATETWYEGAWSDRRGWPSAVTLHEGRLWWAGMDQVYGSVSDEYESFDSDVEGDSGPIFRSIGEGPVDDINWLLGLQRMLVGVQGSELSAKSNSFDEPLTPSNFTLKAASTYGSAAVSPLKIDNSGIFVMRGGERLMQLSYDIDTYDYATSELSRLVPEICEGGIRRIAVQRLPDTRIHCVKNDGTVALLLFDRVEDVMGWVDIETDGVIEDAVVLPDTPEDAVYYVVKRTINSVTKRYLERWAREDECQGEAVTKCVDSHFVYSGVSTATITGLDHLEGETVNVWSNGEDVGTEVVTSGSITLDEATTSAVIGLPYRARYKSTKLAYAAANGTALGMRKRIQQIGLILYKAHAFALQIGDAFDKLRGMPTVRKNKAVGANAIYDHFDEDLTAYNTNWSTDSRLCIEANSPRPVTILALMFNIETNG